jgi:cbb3-type cytochrome oxidase subunit 1
MRRPNIFFYSLLLPTAWLCCSVLFATLFSGKRLGMVGTSLMIIGIVSLISWLFGRRQGREFSAAEYRTIILYCIGWALLLEFSGSFFFLVQSENAHDLSIGALCFAAVFAIVLDSLFVWLAFRNFSRRVIQWHLAKRTAGEVSENKEGPTT